jgi:DNA-binding XRE family transcriptional regulator
METSADLRAWRARRKWTQAQAAAALNFSRRGYQDAEREACKFISTRLRRAVLDFEAREMAA